MAEFSRYLQDKLGLGNLPSIPSDFDLPTNWAPEIPWLSPQPNEVPTPQSPVVKNTIEGIRKLVPDQINKRQTYQNGQCGAGAAIDEKLDEYAAMAQALKDLSGWNGEEAQDKKIEEITENAKGALQFVGDLIPPGSAFIRSAQINKSIAERELASYEEDRTQENTTAYDHFIERQKEKISRYEEEISREQNRYEENKKRTSEAWGSVVAYFKEIYSGFINKLKTCGLISAMQYAHTKLKIFIVETAVIIGTGGIILGGVRYAVKEVSVQVSKGTQLFRVKVDTDQIDTEIKQELDNKDLGNHDERDIPNTKPKTKRDGDLAEKAAANKLRKQGYTEQISLENNSGHGVDIIARNPNTGALKVVEVKANGGTLNADQANLGGPEFLRNRLERAQLSKGHWKSLPEGMDDKIDKLKEWLRGAPSTEYKVWKMDADADTGKTGPIKETDWNYKEGEKPKRLSYRVVPSDKSASDNQLPPSTGPPGAE